MGFIWITEIIQKLTTEDKDKKDWWVNVNLQFLIMIFSNIINLADLNGTPQSLLFFRIVADIINMLQPFYVFIIFCCKRTVLNVVMGKDIRKTYISSRRSSKTRSTINHRMQMSSLQRREYVSNVSHISHSGDTEHLTIDSKALVWIRFSISFFSS